VEFTVHAVYHAWVRFFTFDNVLTSTLNPRSSKPNQFVYDLELDCTPLIKVR